MLFVLNIRSRLTILKLSSSHLVYGEVDGGVAGADYIKCSGHKGSSVAILIAEEVCVETGAITLYARLHGSGCEVHLCICRNRHHVLVSLFVKRENSTVIGEGPVSVNESVFRLNEISHSYFAVVGVDLFLGKGLLLCREEVRSSGNLQV